MKRQPIPVSLLNPRPRREKTMGKNPYDFAGNRPPGLLLALQVLSGFDNCEGPFNRSTTQKQILSKAMRQENGFRTTQGMEQRFHQFLVKSGALSYSRKDRFFVDIERCN